jgi:hypothetical protein
MAAPFGWFDWIEDPNTTPRPPPSEPNWREVVVVLIAITIVVWLAIDFGAVVRDVAREVSGGMRESHGWPRRDRQIVVRRRTSKIVRYGR